MKLILILALIIGGWLLLKPSPCEYRIQVIDTPQTNGTVAHDYARVSMTDGTMCGLHGEFWYNNSLVDSCK